MVSSAVLMVSCVGSSMSHCQVSSRMQEARIEWQRSCSPHFRRMLMVIGDLPHMFAVIGALLCIVLLESSEVLYNGQEEMLLLGL